MGTRVVARGHERRFRDPSERHAPRTMVGGTVTAGEKLFWILAYSACSSSMLVINKLAVQELPLPTVVSGAQLAVSALVVLVLKVIWPTTMGPMDNTKIVPFMVYTAMFAAGLYANMKALMLTNVGAVIAARSCLPVIVCLIEWAFMGRSLPGTRATPRSPASLASPACTSPTTRASPWTAP